MATYFSNKQISYNFTGNAATVNFLSTQITAYPGSSGGSYAITNNNGGGGGVVGGAGGSGQPQGIDIASGGGGGAVGGGNGSGTVGGTFIDQSGFLSAYSLAGYTYNLTVFGKGGVGGGFGGASGGAGNIPGAGGGGGAHIFSTSSYTAVGTGANGAILIQYSIGEVKYYNYINQASGSGTLILPLGTTYVKIWAIGKGADGLTATFNAGTATYTGGAGGRAGGFVYIDFKIVDYTYPVSKIDSSGNFYTGGEIDEFSGNYSILSGKTMTLAFDASGNASVSFLGSTIVGGAGFAVSGSGASPTSGGGSYSLDITPITTAAGVRGGHPSYQSPAQGGWGGSIGARDGVQNGPHVNRIQPHNDVSGLDEVLTILGYDIVYAGGGSLPPLPYTAGQYPGGGGGGGNSGAASLFGGGDAEAGGNAGIFCKYISEGIPYYFDLNQSSGNTTFTLPIKTNYVKIWVVGKGGNGRDGYSQGGWGGGAGGVAYMEFNFNLFLSDYDLFDTNVSKQYIDGVLKISGEIDEVSPTFLGGLTNKTVSYTFTPSANVNQGGTTSASFGGVTITSLPGQKGDGTKDINGLPLGGTYSISISAGVTGVVTGGVNGGRGRAGGGGGNGDAGGGAIGGVDGYPNGPGSVIDKPAADVSGLFNAISNAGYSNTTFGHGGGGQLAGGFAGGGGGSGGILSFSLVAGAGSNGAVVYQCSSSTGNTYGVINQASGNGSITIPTNSYFLKVWAIGGGGAGQNSASFGGSAGAVSYMEFSLSNYGLSNTFYQGTLPQQLGSSTNYATKFNGAQYLTMPSTSNFSFGTGDFTVECWVYTGAPNGSYVNDLDKTVFGGFSASTPAFFCFLQNDTNQPAIWDGSNQYTSSLAVPTNIWSHVAWVRYNSVLAIYVDGVLGLVQPSYTTSFATNNVWYIGRDDTGARKYFSGYISNLRVIKGTAQYTTRYTAPTISFTPPLDISTVSGTVLLTCSSSSSTVDRAGLNTITNFSTTSDRIRSSFNSNYFNGTSHLSLPISADWIMTGDFSIECWIYAESLPATVKSIIDVWNSSGSGNFKLGLSATNFPVFYYDSANFITSSTVITTGTWYHLAAVRVGSAVTLYLNGASVATATFAGTVGRSDLTLDIAKDRINNTFFNGWISNVRIVRGNSIYTTAFSASPPTIQLYPTANTTLLTCKFDTIVDETGKFITNSEAPVTVTERLFPSLPVSSPYVVKKQYSNGDLQVLGNFDEVTYNLGLYAEYLLVGGGGAGGGAAAPYGGGGGGAGGFVEGTFQMLPGTTYNVTVGQGGARVTTIGANGSNGGDSIISGVATAVGGGFGGTSGGYGTATARGADGGSGGGGRSGYGSGQGISGQGSNGGVVVPIYVGSGGGGAGAPGDDGYTVGFMSSSSDLMYAGNGGIGKSSSITGTSTYYAGGGAGGFEYFYTVGGGGQGGLGGGGNGGYNGNGGNGSPNTGSGGGGGGGTQSGNAYGGNGGSGICVIKILTSNYTGLVTGSPTVTTVGSYTIIQFNANGSYKA